MFAYRMGATLGIAHQFTFRQTFGLLSTRGQSEQNWNADHIIDGDVDFNSWNITTTGSTFTITLDTDGTPLTALTLGHTVYDGSSYGSTFDFGTAEYPLLVIKNAPGADGGAEIAGFADSSTPAASDNLLFLNAIGRDSAANIQQYGFLGWTILDPTSTSEDSKFRVMVNSGGSNLTALTLDGPSQQGRFAGGITFNGDTAAANALDDYEEGSYTPTVTGGWTSISYGAQNGYYTKIGQQVTLHGRIQFSGTSAAATVNIGGFPFATSSSTHANLRAGGICHFLTAPTNCINEPGIQVDNPPASTATLYENGVGIVSDGNASSQFINYTITYVTDS